MAGLAAGLAVPDQRGLVACLGVGADRSGRVHQRTPEALVLTMCMSGEMETVFRGFREAAGASSTR
jgi:hypothetical protein